MSWYSLLGVGIAAWVVASVLLAFVLGLLFARRARLDRRPLAPVVPFVPRASAAGGRSRVAG